MAHQAQHLQLVGNVERLAEAAPVRYRQANETSTCSDLQSGAPVDVSSHVSSFSFFLSPNSSCCLSCSVHDTARRDGMAPPGTTDEDVGQMADEGRTRQDRMRQGEAGCDRTHMRASRSSSRWYRSICLASTTPAGHVWPPHPEARSSWTLSGVESRPPKSRAVSPAGL